jgi:hypothetical protein
MREVSRMMGEMGLDGSLAEAIAARHESFAETQAVDGGPTAPGVRACDLNVDSDQPRRATFSSSATSNLIQFAARALDATSRATPAPSRAGA